MKTLPSFSTLPEPSMYSRMALSLLTPSIPHVSARVSVTSPHTRIKVPSECFFVLVQTANANSDAILITLPEGSQQEALLAPADTCLLPPGGSAEFESTQRNGIVLFELTRTSLRIFSVHRTGQQTDTLRAPLFTKDPILHLLSRSLLPLLEQEEEPRAEFVRYFLLSLYTHLIDNYGAKSSSSERFVGGLSPQHKRIAEEVLQASQSDAIDIGALAKECGISRRHFARAFRQSFGTSIHQHIVQARIRRAKELLIGSNMPLKSIARALGYSDQTTFTESFARVAGSSPGRFRRRYTTLQEEQPQREISSPSGLRSRAAGNIASSQ